MTANEAIKILEVAKAECEWNAPLDYQEAFDLAISALQAQDVPDTNVGKIDRYGYIGIETLLNFCENSKDHAVTPNDFMRMKRVRMPEPCEDAVSRKDILDGAITHYSVSGANITYRNAVPVEYIESLPSVTPKQGSLDSDEAAKRLNDLIFDINPAEICSQIESDNLINWCKTIQTEMKMAMVQLPCWAGRRTDERTD